MSRMLVEIRTLKVPLVRVWKEMRDLFIGNKDDPYFIVAENWLNWTL